MNKKLSELEPGQSGIIQAVKEDEMLLKLMEMGFLPGELVTVEQVAPLGDPIAIRVAGYAVSLRLHEASKIVVKALSNN